VGFDVSMPIERIRRLTPFFSNRSIIETKSVGYGSGQPAYFGDHERITRPSEGDSLFQGVTRPRALVCSRHRFTPFGQQIAFLGV
jgi:hypothetical protein